MAILTGLAVKADDTENNSRAALGIAVETRRANRTAASVKSGSSNGSTRKESGDSEELHVEMW
ncbi:uncharacterized protein G6M90_00g006620 [Metarhizium brunneum]|uniref:Uncharacterized protein n=1 Tax=Metarhizium brunneum TaxID=500148 RepID=A0A7D5YKR7_9HYPO|nr:hypothetical protein G6M90_00g006620 [Metarhizium brunneum]